MAKYVARLMNQNTFRIFVSVFLLVVITIMSFQIIVVAKERQTIIHDHSELSHVKYGMLSVHAWKEKIAGILAKKVREFQLTANNKEELRALVADGLYKLIDEVERIFEERNTKKSWFKKTITEFIQSIVLEFDEIRKKVPRLTEIILLELDKFESREKLRVFIQEKIDELVERTVGEEDFGAIDLLLEKHNCEDINFCTSYLNARLNKIDAKQKSKAYVIFLLSAVFFLVVFFRNYKIGRTLAYLSIILCIVLLLGGILTPMIDIDARIDRFDFTLLSEQITFENQVLFFQSKSIFEVVQILYRDTELQSKIIGILIFLFSIIFPFFKISASFFLLNKSALIDNRWIRFFGLRSSKWSMADVIVVGIFMSYIGFRGIINSQLMQLEEMSKKIEILTTDNSSLSVGFVLFLTFCLSGLALSSVLESRYEVRWILKEKDN
jgi:hypothetical protein